MIGIAEFHPMILWEFSLNSDGLNHLLGFGLLWSIRESIVQPEVRIPKHAAAVWFRLLS